ncbi:MAG: iron-sulfur cluster repair di-iron protein [Candidatus Poribacteria bacterium]|nr:MAG: iron-sulfur cluster repair di-iron protein [Candidatus Poribacteria bacterium]
MHIEASVPIGELAVRIPGALDVFERYRLDYCCHGSRSLEEACAQRGVPLATVLQELREAAERSAQEERTTNWDRVSLRELCRHIVAEHHAYLRAELPRLEPYLQKIARVHRERHPELVELCRLFQELSEEIRHHLREEEEGLFPQAVRTETALAIGEAASLQPIAQAIEEREREHERAGALLDSIRRLLDDYTVPEDACPTYRHVLESLERLERDMHRHIHLENNVLHPRLRRLDTLLASGTEELSVPLR